MNVLINGESREVPDGLTVAGLLVHLGIHPGRVAVERNLEILFRSLWESTLIQPGDRYEIVHMVGGG
jgi:sulfur carrier protein